jgi:hypothetical protein
MILVFYPDKNVDDILRADEGPLTSKWDWTTFAGGGKEKDGV